MDNEQQKVFWKGNIFKLWLKKWPRAETDNPTANLPTTALNMQKEVWLK